MNSVFKDNRRGIVSNCPLQSNAMDEEDIKLKAQGSKGQG
jgi:hypothetical protein